MAERRPTAIPCFSTSSSSSFRPSSYPPHFISSSESIRIHIPWIRHFLASLDLSSASPPVFIVSPFLPARYTEIEGKQDGRFEKPAFIQPVISSAMRGCVQSFPSFLSSFLRPQFLFLSFPSPSNWILVSSNRGERERGWREISPLFSK